ncbi:MAG: PHP domain-containing protein, partial [Chloroflexi bacterium]|nr:PHP domain-containing protein [Chloroflexota bacterium]
MKKADLHAHTTASDGTFTPAELIAEAKRAGLDALGITDHDSTEGIREARIASAKPPGHVLIPGVEMGCDVAGSEVNML